MPFTERLLFWFDLFFSPLMILVPALLFIWLGRRTDHMQFDAVRAWRLKLALWGSTLAALAVFAGLWAWAGREAARFAWAFCFPLFTLAAAAAAANNPNWMAAHTAQVQRTASLRVRARENPVPAWFWNVCWLAWFAAAAAVVVRWLHAPPLGSGVAWAVTALVALACGPLVLALGRYSVGRALEEAEPLIEGAPELEAGYAASRQSRAWGLAVGAALLAHLWLGAAVVMSWFEPRWWWGVVGGVAGSMIGIAGGVFGTLAGRRRMQLNALYRRLAANQASNAGSAGE